jgi:clan AA aspartic protease (TIGR02281 family)
MWLDLSASGKEAFLPESTRRIRDDVAKRMTPEQISQAQEMSRRCKQSNFKDCGEDKGIAGSVASNIGASRGTEILMKKHHGTYVVPVLINNAIMLDFIIDSGATDVSIPADVVTTLMRAGTIQDTDFIGERTYVLADGSRVQAKTFRIRSLKVGDRILENVTGSVAPTKGSLLLGQSFLGRFKSWSIDNSRHALVLD